MAFLPRRASLAVIGVIAAGVPMLFASPAAAASSLSAPTGLAPNSSTVPQKDPVLSWGVVSGASGYEVELSKSNDWSDSSTEVTLPDSGASSTNSLALPQPLDHGVYFWRVRAENSATTGDWSSNALIDKDWDDAPSTVNSTPTGDATVPQSGIADYPWRFAWTPLQDASSYEIEFSHFPTFDAGTTSGKDNDGTDTVDCLTEATSFTPYSTVAVEDNGVDACDLSNYSLSPTTYWRVRGVDDSASGDADEGPNVPVECYGTQNNESTSFPDPSVTTTVALGTPTSAGQECSEWSQTQAVDGVTLGSGDAAESLLGNVTGSTIENCGTAVGSAYSCTSMPEIAWQPVTGADSYTVTVADDSSFNNDEHVYQTPFLSLTPRDVIPNYTAGKGYYVAVRACTSDTPDTANGGCSDAQVMTFTLRVPTVTNLAQATVNGGERLSWTDLLARYNTALTGGAAAEAENYRVEVTDASDTDFDSPVITDVTDAACDRTVSTCYNPTGSPTSPGTDSVVVSPAASGSYIWRVTPMSLSGIAYPAAVGTSAFTVDLTSPQFSFSTKNGFAVNAPLTIHSSEPVTTAVNSSTVHVVPAGAPLSAAVPGTLRLGANNTTWVFRASRPFATGGSYVLSVDDSVVDDNGNSAVVTGNAIRATTVAKDTSPGWTYSSGWTKHAASGARSGSFKSAGSGHSASLSVAGSEAVLYGCKSPHMGTISVTVAGHKQSVSEHQSFTRCGVELWSKALPKGNQTLTVAVTHGTGDIDEVKVS